MGAPDRRRPASAAAERHRVCCQVALLLSAVGCQAIAYEPLVVEPSRGLPADAYARCRALLCVRYQRLVVDDETTFRLQTDWVAGPDPEIASQQRATMFRQGGGIGCVVEARYLRMGWFDTVPGWSAARPDARLERDLAVALTEALGGS